MGLLADLTAYVMQRSAPRTVDYGDSLYFSGLDLPDPSQIGVPTRHGDVRCDVYRPADDGGVPPAYVHFHGGAFIMRHPMMDDFFARFMAAETGAVVVNVDYDVAPQRRYPVAQHQAHDVAAWVAAHGEECGWDGSRLAIGGFSAGGNLAASACLQARDAGSFRATLQVLAVPALDVAESVTDKTSPCPTPMISASLLRLVRRVYFPRSASRNEPYASPLLAPDLTDVSPAFILTGEYDVLRTEGDAYAARLTDAGVVVIHRVVPGVDHYFLDGGRDQARQTLDLLANELRRRFGAD